MFWKSYACSNYVLLSKTCCQLLHTNKYWLANEALAEVPALAEAEATGALLGWHPVHAVLSQSVPVPPVPVCHRRCIPAREITQLPRHFFTSDSKSQSLSLCPALPPSRASLIAVPCFWGPWVSPPPAVASSGKNKPSRHLKDVMIKLKDWQPCYCLSLSP